MHAVPMAEDKARFVAAMFGRIAPRYDLMNSLITLGQDRHWRELVAAAVAADLGSGSTPRNTDGAAVRVLDVGTGTGKLARALAARLPSATVTGVDFAQPMLRASPRCAQPTIALAAADALTLPFADATFNAVVSGFLVRNVADVAQGIAEQVRVLRPGGRLVVLETTPGPPGALRPPYRLYFRHLVPLLGDLIVGDGAAYTYLPESSLAFLEPARLAGLLRANGLRDVSTRSLLFGCVAMTQGLRPA